MNKDEMWPGVEKALEYHGLAARNQKAFDKGLHDENLKSRNEWQDRVFAQTRSMARATWFMALATWSLFLVSYLGLP